MRAPRRSACSRSSSTRMPAPSAITKPSRSRSNGRDACSGSRRDRGEGAERAVARDDHRRERRIGAAREHRVGAVLADQRERGADRIGARGAGGAWRRRGAAQAERARRRRRGDVRQRERDRERADAVGTALVERLVGVRERLRAAVCRADRGADAARREVEVATGVLEREQRSRRRELAAAIHPACVATREPVLGVEALDRAEHRRGDAGELDQLRAAAARPRGNPRTPRRRSPWGRSHRDPVTTTRRTSGACRTVEPPCAGGAAGADVERACRPGPGRSRAGGHAIYPGAGLLRGRASGAEPERT